MKLFKRMKDGGPESRVEGFWLIEAKGLLSVVLLHFSNGSREAFHSHAFHAVSWLLKGKLVERRIMSQNLANDYKVTVFEPSLLPIITTRQNFHKVSSIGDSWAISFRGPWVRTWREYLPNLKKFITLTNGRKVVSNG